MSSPPPLPAPRDSAMLAWIHQSAPYGVFTTDTQLRVQTWNHWLQLHGGLKPSSVLGRALFELFPCLPERRLASHFHRALAGETSVLATALHGYLLPLPPAASGAGFPFMRQTARIAPLVFPDGIGGVIVVIEDVTQREIQASLLRQQHERDEILSWALAFLLQSQEPRRTVRELFCKLAQRFDFDAYLLYLAEPNPNGPDLKLRALGGVPPDSVPAVANLSGRQPLAQFLLRLRNPISFGDLDSTQTDSPLSLLARPLGLRACAVLPLRAEDAALGALCFGARSRPSIDPAELDLLSTISQYLAAALHKELTASKLRAAQTLLNQHALDLEIKVKERTETLRETIAELETFSYTLAHDLRAPVRALLGYCGVLTEDFSPQLPAEAQRIIAKLNAAGAQLNTLISDLLEFAKVSRLDVKLASIDLNELVRAVVDIASHGRSCRILIQHPLHPVRAHRMLLQQCLANLVDNGLKFVPPGAQPHLQIRTELTSASPGPDAAPRVRIIVADNGIGVPPELHQKIFGIFERGARSNEFEGTGIGLAIVARATQRMGGRCGVISTPGAGSQFWIELDPDSPA